MVGELAKNLWLLLTLAIPGLVTYGTFRLLLALDPDSADLEWLLTKFDDSAFLSTCVVLAIAVSQQAIAITIEAMLTCVATGIKKLVPSLYELFCDRFRLAAEGRLGENATRIVGQSFLSMDVTIGMALLLAFFVTYGGKLWWSPVPMVLIGLVVIGAVTTMFRFCNAAWVIHAIEVGSPSRNPENPTPCNHENT